MIDTLINQISNSTIQDFFKRKIAAYQPIEEKLNHIIDDEGRFENFSELKKLGEVEFDDSDELLVFSCQYNGELSERASKKKQFDIAKKALNEDFKDGAIFIFFDEKGKFRFSFIRKNYGDKEKKYSNWKRYTYFVNPELTNRTFKQRIESCTFASLDVILEAFSVGPLNKEFYDKIVRSFYSLVGGEIGLGRNKEKFEPNLILPQNITDRKIVRQFAVRLVGRIIFCWFLKHKTSKQGVPLIPHSWLKVENVHDGYYHSRLEKLFFEILNKKIKDRKKDLPEGHEKIPFLNGGLFEPQNGNDSDYYQPNISASANYTLKIADKWFKELFETLEQYNFTIDENSVNDAEVSIDPEMLGRIFENLLAEIDPNLESSEKKSVRKATGSFYTPREIVDYMVEEALVKYLHNTTDFSEKELHSLFIENGELNFNKDQRIVLLDALDKVKILDPAAGSGAFPMGALHKIVQALQKLDPGAEQWKQKQLEKINNAILYDEMKAILDKSNAEYSRKLGVLQHCIYGADIQPIAAEISRLRSFLSLIVDEEIDDKKYNRGIIALPNLDFKFVTANTLIGLSNTGSLETNKVNELLPKLQKVRNDYLQAHGDDKEKLRKEFANIQNNIHTDQLKYNPDPNSRPMQLASWSPFKNEVAQWFEPEWMFGVKQFDIVIGNPPYGGTKITDELKSKLGLGSKDPYGAFIARFLRRKAKSENIMPDQTPLKHKGILSFIVSDTFMTIKSHKALRDLMLENNIHSMLRVHSDTFKATVNTAVILCERLEVPDDNNNKVLMADFTNISIHVKYERFMQLLDKTVQYEQPEYDDEALEQEGVLYMKGVDWTSESSEEYAIYTYPQQLIETNSNHPFFVASPKLFAFMNDTTAPKKQIKMDEKTVQARTIRINGESVDVVKLGDIAEVKQGLATGDNDAYLFQNPEARGTYRDINDFKDYLLTENDLNKIRSNEKLRLEVIDKGISKDDTNSERYFGGRYIIPYDKGGESDSDGGWLPNYYVPTNYFIDWSEWAVNRMKTLTIGQRDNNSNNKICSRFQSVEFSFKHFLTYSRTGMYAPTFRQGSNACFDSKSNCVIFSKPLNNIVITNSKIFRFLYKNYQCHTVQAEADIMLEFPMARSINQIDFAIKLIQNIIDKQKQNSNYDYSTNEQNELDLLTYISYSLDHNDIIESENWYARRYPKLVNAQKENLAKLGKPTNYIELYKQLEEKYGGLN